MKIEWGCWGFDLQGENVRVVVSLYDVEVSVGAYSVGMLRTRKGVVGLNGLTFMGPRGSRFMDWHEVKAWLTRKPTAPLDAV